MKPISCTFYTNPFSVKGVLINPEKRCFQEAVTRLCIISPVSIDIAMKVIKPYIICDTGNTEVRVITCGLKLAEKLHYSFGIEEHLDYCHKHNVLVDEVKEIINSSKNLSLNEDRIICEL